MRLALCVATYNRLAYLRAMLTAWEITRDPRHDWGLYIVDDGSQDGTRQWLADVTARRTLTEAPTYVIHQDRLGIHEARNALFAATLEHGFDVAFHCDDDVQFVLSGWEDLYLRAMRETGFAHLVFCDPRFAKQHRPKNECRRAPAQRPFLDSWVPQPTYCQGAFWTITPRVIETVGWFDGATFGPCGYGHVDFTVRCCRAGFNDAAGGPWDAAGATRYLMLRCQKYTPAISAEARSIAANRHSPLEAKAAALADSNRIWVDRSSPRGDMRGELRRAATTEDHPA